MSFHRIRCPVCHTKILIGNSRLTDTLHCLSCGASLRFEAIPAAAPVALVVAVLLGILAYAIGYRGSKFALAMICGTVLTFILCVSLIHRSLVFRIRISEPPYEAETD